MFPVHSNYRRDGATKPLFRSRVSMMTPPSASSCPPRTAAMDDDEKSSRSMAVATSTERAIHVKTNAATFNRPRPRIWSRSSPSFSDCDDTDGYYSSSSSSDSESEDEQEYDDDICDKNDLSSRRHIISRRRRQKNKKRRPISPTSCTAFDEYQYQRGRRPAKRRRSSSSGRRVTFALNPVDDVRYRPRTLPEDKRKLFYSKRDISGFRSAYYQWLDEGQDPSDLFDLKDDDEDNKTVIATSVPPKKVDRCYFLRHPRQLIRGGGGE
mmetsp:Transcript_1820/g.5315  ORF Transcript_1820/g.5315 Transcript_1820/m.5315 type:complete len:267 (-) Transcript_1820:547-1347(-)